MKVTVITDQGMRPYMEDTFISHVSEKGSFAIFGVFDGHGGSEVADYCPHSFKEHIEKVGMPLNSNQWNHVFSLVDNGVKYSTPNAHVGSTAVVACISSNNTFSIANAGDSLGILIKKNGVVEMLSYEHKVDKEKDRLLALGAQITYDDGVGRLFRTLNVSRGIGDHFLRPYHSATPYVHGLTALSEDDVCLFLASDGIWDVFTANEIGFIFDQYYVQEKRDVSFILKVLVGMARNRRSGDNITAMVVGFK